MHVLIRNLDQDIVKLNCYKMCHFIIYQFNHSLNGRLIRFNEFYLKTLIYISSKAFILVNFEVQENNLSFYH